MIDGYINISEAAEKWGMSFPENFHFTVPIFLSAVLYAGGVY